jgi:major membrane immunogen (membrane-anchored lipoprotein)
MVVLGCGGDESGLGRRFKVTGKVTYKGAPLPFGKVTFLPTKPPVPEGRAAQGEIKDGVYSLSTTGNDDGALAGEYDVVIVAQDIDMASAASSKAEGGQVHQGDAAYQKAHKNAKKLIPTKYTSGATSGLKATVGTGANNFDYDLKDD